MDQTGLKEKISVLIFRYKYVILVLLIGIGMMLMPTSNTDTEPSPPVDTAPQVTLGEELEQILSQMDGVGKARVLLSQGDGPVTVYQTDEDRNQDGSVRIETVIVSSSDRGEAGLVKSVTPPTYLGAVVVCQGADRPAVRLAVIQAVSNVTGISTDRITCVKMK